MTQFEKAIKEEVICDICGGIMHPMYGGGWDNDRIVCANKECQAEIEYPTSTEVPEPIINPCLFCEKGKLELVKANPPWTEDHYQCPVCDGTYNKGEIESENRHSDI